MSLSRDQIQMSHDRCAERSGEEIIAHRKVLSVVPQGSYGVAVVISHGEIRSAPGSGRTERLRHFVDEPVVIGGLFIGVVTSAVGIVYLSVTTNLLAALLAALTVGTYVFVYTPLKRVTTLNTIVGAVPGALPPVIGWAAA